MFPLSKYAPLTSPLGLGNPLNVLAQIGTVPFVRYFTEIFGQLEFELVPLEFELVPLEFELVPLEFELVPLEFELVPLEFELVPLEFELVTLVLVDAFSEKSDETPVEQAPTAKTVKVMMLVTALLTMGFSLGQN